MGIFAATFALLVFSVHAENMKPIDIYQRCYIKMVRMVPDETDALFIAVKNGTKTPEDACLELFDLARFSPNGVMVNRTNPEAKAILRTFNELHGSWFQSRTNTYPAVGYMIRDSDEASLYFTRAAFLPNTPFSSVVTLGHGLTGVRDQKNYPNEENPFMAQRLIRYSTQMAYYGEQDLILGYRKISLNSRGGYVDEGSIRLRMPGDRITEVGELVGIKPAIPLVVPSFRSNANATVREAVNSSMVNFDFNRHFGGGILGSQAYFLNNSNLGGTLAEGVARINRRLTARLFEDLLCHQLPTLGPDDVQTVPGSPHAFEKNKACMQCHTSIDPLGFGYRNLFLTTSLGAVDQLTTGLLFNSVAQIPPSSTATAFAGKIPEGELNYRELITGTKRNNSFNSLTNLGTIIAGQSDLYTCAAKRYYTFFTGVDVALTVNALDPANTTPVDRKHQQEVIKLATAFKASKNVRSLLRGIFASPTYKSSHYLTEAVK